VSRWSFTKNHRLIILSMKCADYKLRCVGVCRADSRNGILVVL